MADVTKGGATKYTFTVIYTAEPPSRIDGETIRRGEITVTGPGFSQKAVRIPDLLIHTTANGIGYTYEIAAPEGAWNSSHNGTYSVWISGGMVKDTRGRAVAEAEIGRFVVFVYRPGSSVGLGMSRLPDARTTALR